MHCCTLFGINHFPCHLFTDLVIIFPVVKSGGAAPFIEALPLVFGLDAAAASASYHANHSVENRDQKESGDETEDEDVHRRHAGSVHGGYEANHKSKPDYANDS